jgi:pimeloyl-ACP methyl ester carboxylesterase
MRSGQQAALAQDLNGLIDLLDLQQPILVGYDWGARAACTTAALWPAKIGGLIPIGGYNIETFTLDREPAPARSEHKAWYDPGDKRQKEGDAPVHSGRGAMDRGSHALCINIDNLPSRNVRSPAVAQTDTPSITRIVSSFHHPKVANSRNAFYLTLPS